MTAEAAPHGIAIAADGRRVLATRVLLGAAVLLIVAVLLSLSVGPTGITLASLPRVIAAWLGGENDAATAREQLVLIDIRLPRTLLAVFVGASLAVAGAMMQGLFRNPLADPGLIGVSSGAALAAVATIALGNGIAAPILQPLGVYALPVTAFLGGAITTLALVGFAGRQGRLMIGTLLLAGVAHRRLHRRAHGSHRVHEQRPRAARPDAVDHGKPRRRELAQGRRRASLRGA